MIKVKYPRYADKKILLARYRLTCGQDVEVQILAGNYKGIYKVTNEVICKSPIETHKTRNGHAVSMRAVDLSQLERIR